MKVRLPPLAAALALVAAALLATTWSTRSIVDGVFAALRDGQTLAIQHAVRADLADLGGPPTVDDLGAVLRDRAGDGLRYVAMLDSRGHVTASAGTPVGELPGRRTPGIEHVGDRLRIELRESFRRAWGEGGRPWRVVMEVDPVQAAELRDAATRTLAIGAVGAMTLLGVAIALVRRELRRSAEDRARERERRLASLGEMSAVLAHEIRNPLASLKGNAQLLAASMPEGGKPRTRADRVVDEAVRLEQLTQDLLAFVRTGELTRDAVAPAALVRDAAAPLGVSVNDAGAPASWSLDAARIREVIVNLLDNAVAAGPPARVTVRTERERLVIEIVDHGPGVPAADRAKIFEPFFTGKTSGTGLGLAIARRIVELHRGTIAVDDAPGGGARFRIEIPEA